MLVQTNDGFTGGDRLYVPNLVAKGYCLNTHDAGTGANKALAQYVPGPSLGGTLREPITGTIDQHPGLQVVGVINPEIDDWDDPSARVTITQMDS